MVNKLIEFEDGFMDNVVALSNPQAPRLSLAKRIKAASGKRPFSEAASSICATNKRSPFSGATISTRRGYRSQRMEYLRCVTAA
jgi:hypothetical protein